MSAPDPAFFGGPLLDFSWFGSSLLLGGVIVGILAVVLGIVASWVGVMLLV